MSMTTSNHYEYTRWGGRLSCVNADRVEFHPAHVAFVRVARYSTAIILAERNEQVGELRQVSKCTRDTK